jgi:hypothetical protein
MQALQPHLHADNSMVESLIANASTDGSPEFVAMEILLKGMEVALPAGTSFLDKDKNERNQVRTKWWLQKPATFADLALPDYVVRDNPGLAEVPAPPGTFIDHGPKPVFFGHYWFNGTPAPLADNAACLDYSVARKGGLLTAYRWQGEASLSNDHFVSVPSMAR